MMKRAQLLLCLLTASATASGLAPAISAPDDQSGTATTGRIQCENQFLAQKLANNVDTSKAAAAKAAAEAAKSKAAADAAAASAARQKALQADKDARAAQRQAELDRRALVRDEQSSRTAEAELKRAEAANAAPPPPAVAAGIQKRITRLRRAWGSTPNPTLRQQLDAQIRWDQRLLQHWDGHTSY